MPLSHKTGEKVVIGITSQTGLLIFVWFICRIILYNGVIVPFLADKMKKLFSILTLFVFLVVPSLIIAQPPHVLWSTTFGGENNDYGYSVQETEDNGFILISKTESYGNGDNDVWLIKS